MKTETAHPMFSEVAQNGNHFTDAEAIAAEQMTAEWEAEDARARRLQAEHDLMMADIERWYAFEASEQYRPDGFEDCPDEYLPNDFGYGEE